MMKELDWWEKPIKKSHLGQIKFMITEILFVKSLFHDNRKLWYVSFPFHFGIYMLIGSLGLLFIGAVVDIAKPAYQSEIAVSIRYLAMAHAIIGSLIGSIGCFGLFLKRIFDKDMRAFAAPIDYFNLLFILSIFLSGLIAWSSSSLTYSLYQGYIKSMITFTPMNIQNPILTVHIILLSLFGIYMPFTHMTHFLGKYFMWHEVRWDDERNMRGSAIEAKVNILLNQKQYWSAPHIKSGKTWAENATEEVE